jgi:hypothetical protein
MYHIKKSSIREPVITKCAKYSIIVTFNIDNIYSFAAQGPKLEVSVPSSDQLWDITIASNSIIMRITHILCAWPHLIEQNLRNEEYITTVAISKDDVHRAQAQAYPFNAICRWSRRYPVLRTDIIQDFRTDFTLEEIWMIRRCKIPAF